MQSLDVLDLERVEVEVVEPEKRDGVLDVVHGERTETAGARGYAR